MSNQKESRTPEDAIFVDELSPEQPPIPRAIESSEENDDTFHVAPPQLSTFLEDEEQTIRSIEVARGRVEDGRLSGESYGVFRQSDRHDGISALEVGDASRLGIEDNTVSPAMGKEGNEDSHVAHQLDFGSVKT